MNKTEEWTTITLSDAVKKRLFQCKNAIEKDKGRIVSYDEVISILLSNSKFN
jgi:predicted transcriptional regulator